MLILSIDVGIKNLSFCLFEINPQSTTDIKIIKWDNIDLSEKTESKCIEIDKNGLCEKPAKFMKEGKCYCLKHSKKHNFLQPTPELKPSYLNKQKIQNLIVLADKYKIKYENPPKKLALIDHLSNFATQNCYLPIEKENASKVNLVTIGRNIQHKFDEILEDHLLNINKIIIENQIGPIANKMKTIQGMLSQYFIMKNNNIEIEFISALNKLKDFMPKNKDNKEKEKPEKMDYKQRKKLGVQTCLEMVNSDFRFKDWETFFAKHNKKDDLSDCFLQGIWYIKYKI
jgi:hypothetical protein